MSYFARGRVTYGSDGVGCVSQQLYSVLTSLQMGLSEDKMGWIVELKQQKKKKAFILVAFVWIATYFV